jgi:hypothetical protein
LIGGYEVKSKFRMSDNNSNQDHVFRNLTLPIIELGRTVENGSEHDKIKLGFHFIDKIAQNPPISKILNKLDESDFKHLIMGVTRAEMRVRLIFQLNLVHERYFGGMLLRELQYRYHIFCYNTFHKNSALSLIEYLKLHYIRQSFKPLRGERLLLDLAAIFFSKSHDKVDFGHLNWDCGSVTMVPQLLDIYAERFGLDCADALVVWCRKNTSDRNVPFGSYSGDMTYRQHVLPLKVLDPQEWFWDKIEGLRRKKRQREEELQNDIVRAKIRQEYDIKRRKYDIKRQTFLDKLSCAPHEKRFKIITQSDMALEAVPIDLIKTEPGIIKSLDEETKRLLLLKIDRRNRGVWGRTKRLLLEENTY